MEGDSICDGRVVAPGKKTADVVVVHSEAPGEGGALVKGQRVLDVVSEGKDGLLGEVREPRIDGRRQGSEQRIAGLIADYHGFVLRVEEQKR